MNKAKREFLIWTVDDEPGMCSGAKSALENYTAEMIDLDKKITFRVELMGTGEELLRALAERPRPQILLLDNKLPGISGIEILERFRSEGIDILTVMITAYATFEHAVEATKQGAFDFLAKPFTPNELRYAVEKAVRHFLLTEKARVLEAEKKRVRFEFISVLAHELKSPLNAIEGYVDFLENRRLGESVSGYAQIIERLNVRARGMRKLITDLLDLTRIESGERKRELAICNLRNIAEESIEGLDVMIKEKQINVNLRSEPDNPEMMADHSEIGMLFNNLISNAVKYNRKQGEVNVEIIGKDNNAIIKVADTGIGIEREEQEMLFKEFSRVKNEKTRRVNGSGLGLSILKKIVQLYSGSVKVESVSGQGSVFTVEMKRWGGGLNIERSEQNEYEEKCTAGR
ncbi:MAG: HAMP domain-containing sensor histidine kinase [Candidatus Margulisiibacteriota bacterium]